MILRKFIAFHYLYLQNRNTQKSRFVHKQKAIASFLHLPIMPSEDRRSSRHGAEKNAESRNKGSEDVHRRSGASHTSGRAIGHWQNQTPGTPARTPISPIFEDSRDLGRGKSRLDVSPPSAAATAREGVYVPQPKRQSTYTKESLLSRDQHAAGSSKPRPNRNSAYGESSPRGHNTVTVAPPPRNLTRLHKQDYQLGMIIRALVHEDSMDRAAGSSVTITDRSVTESKFGPICSKWRKMIVVGAFENHYLAVPIYTHNGHGLTRKANPNEFVSIRDHRRPEPFDRLSSHRPLVTKYIHQEIYSYDPLSTAHVTYAISRGYVLPVVEEGFLDYDSTKRLLELARTFTPPPLRLCVHCPPNFLMLSLMAPPPFVTLHARFIC